MRCVIARYLVEDAETGAGDILEITLAADWAAAWRLESGPPQSSEAFRYALSGTVPPRWIKNGSNAAQLENFIQTSGLYDVIAREWYGLLGGVSTP
jgi:hypothetical protein